MCVCCYVRISIWENDHEIHVASCIGGGGGGKKNMGHVVRLISVQIGERQKKVVVKFGAAVHMRHNLICRRYQSVTCAKCGITG